MTDSSSKLLQIQGKWYQERKPTKNPEPEPKKIQKLFWTVLGMKRPYLMASAQKNHKTNWIETQTWQENMNSIAKRQTTLDPQTSKGQRRHVKIGNGPCGSQQKPQIFWRKSCDRQGFPGDLDLDPWTFGSDLDRWGESQCSGVCGPQVIEVESFRWLLVWAGDLWSSWQLFCPKISCCFWLHWGRCFWALRESRMVDSKIRSYPSLVRRSLIDSSIIITWPMYSMYCWGFNPPGSI